MVILVVRQRLCNRCTCCPSGHSHVGLLFANDDHKKLAQDVTATEALYGYIRCNTKKHVVVLRHCLQGIRRQKTAQLAFPSPALQLDYEVM